MLFNFFFFVDCWEFPRHFRLKAENHLHQTIGNYSIYLLFWGKRFIDNDIRILLKGLWNINRDAL